MPSTAPQQRDITRTDPRREALDERDAALLRRTSRPRWMMRNRRGTVRVVDLFSGCGGMSLGVALAALDARLNFEPVLAVDSDESATTVHEANFPAGEVHLGSVLDLFDGRLGSPLTATERRTRRTYPRPDFLVGGPPCQGNSNLNNHTRRKDARNRLYARMARAAQVLRPRVVVIENVATVIHDRGHVVTRTTKDLMRQGYRVVSSILPTTATGVPQLRKRHVLLAIREPGVDPAAILFTLQHARTFAVPRGVGWAIEDLVGVGPDDDSIFDRPSEASPENRARMEWLIENGDYWLPNRLRPRCHRGGGHTYFSIYGRMHWDEPAQTITTGFNCTGQGCFVHPLEPRTITPHEAARIQTFPDFFDFRSAGTRSAMSRMIGNAVPPFFMRALVGAILSEPNFE